MLTHLHIANRKDVALAASALHNMGVQYVFITMGAEGAFLSNGEIQEFMPSLVHDAVSTNGCGDACLAGLVYTYLMEKDCATMLHSSMAMAEICAESPNAVSESVTPEILEERLKCEIKEAIE